MMNCAEELKRRTRPAASAPAAEHHVQSSTRSEKDTEAAAPSSDDLSGDAKPAAPARESTATTTEEKEAQDPPEHLADDEPYQCSEAHTAPAEVKSDTVQAAVAEPEEAADCEQCLQKETQREESERWPHDAEDSSQCLLQQQSLQRKEEEEKEAQDPAEHLAVDEPYQCSEAHTAPAEADAVEAAVAETEEAADCKQCLQKETQRQEESERWPQDAEDLSRCPSQQQSLQRKEEEEQSTPKDPQLAAAAAASEAAEAAAEEAKRKAEDFQSDLEEQSTQKDPQLAAAAAASEAAEAVAEEGQPSSGSAMQQPMGSQAIPTATPEKELLQRLLVQSQDEAGHEVDVGAATPAEKTGTEQELAVAIRQSVNNFLAGDSSSCGDDDCDLEELYDFDAKKMAELAEKGGEINEEELVGSSGLMDSAPVSSPTELPVPTEMPSPTEGIEGTEEVRTQDATETREPTEVVLPRSSAGGLLESAPPASPSMLPVPTQRPSPTSPPTEGKVPVPVSAVAFASPSLMSSAPVSPSMLPVPTEMPSSPTATPREATQEADALLKAKAAAAEASQKEAKEIRSVVEELRKFQDDLRAHLRQMEADASNRDKVEEDLRAQLRKMEAVAEDLRAQLRKVEADASNKDKVAEWQTVGPDGWVRCIPCNKVVDDNHNSSGNHIRRLKSWLAHEQRKKTGYAAPALEYLAYVPSIPGDDTSERWLKCLLCGKFVQDDTSHSGTKEKPQGSGKHRKNLTKYVGTAWYQENVINERLKWHPPTQVPYPSSLQTGLPSADAAAEGEEFSC